MSILYAAKLSIFLQIHYNYRDKFMSPSHLLSSLVRYDLDFITAR